MTTKHKCQAIIERIIELTNLGQPVLFHDDFGGHTLTVLVGKSHTHCGVPDGSFNQLVDSLHATLTGGPGLSWSPETPDGIGPKACGGEEAA